MTEKLNILFVLVLLMALGGKCHDDKGSFAEGEFRDLKGLSGCSWVIELNDGTRLEPLNLADFEISPEEGQRVRIQYEEKEEIATNCMVGPVIYILGIKKL